MINIIWLVLIMPICFILGYFWSSIFELALRKDEEVKEAINKEEKTEEIIDVLLQHGYVESSRAENDYDLNIGKVGTEKIQKILGGYD